MNLDLSSLQTYATKNILITGGLGFIGSNLAIELVRLGAKVTLVDAHIPETGWNKFNITPVSKDVEVVKLNIHSEKMKPYVTKADYIFNLAGVLSHVDSLKDPMHDLQINTVDQVAFVVLCQQHNPDVKIIYTGTRNQYGKAQSLPVSEDHPFDPIDTNGISEVAAEMYHTLYWKLYGLRSTSLRLCNVFGPRHQMRHPRQGVLNWFLRLLLEGKKVPLMGGGTQIRDCVYVNDVVNALLLLGIHDASFGQAFNIGAYPISLKEFVERSIDVIGKGMSESVPFPDDRLRIEPGDYIANYDKLEKITGWKPQWNLEDALKETFEYYSLNKHEYWS